jgi:uncharacterized protein with HEPN domain
VRPRPKAIDLSKGKQRRDLDDDELLRLALTKLVEIVGEAAKSISPEGRTAMPQVPWRAAARMRDRLVHHYFDINLDILWQTITEDLPQLLAALPSEDAAALNQRGRERRPSRSRSATTTVWPHTVQSRARR